MIAELLVLVPAIACIVSALLGSRRPGAVVVVGLVTAGAGSTLLGWHEQLALPPGAGGDPLSALFLALANVIFLGVAVFAAGLPDGNRETTARFNVLSLAFLTAVNASLMANDLFLEWLGLEASALAMAPLIVRPGHADSRRASWYYALFSTVALSLAFIGLVCLAIARGHDAHPGALVLSRLSAAPPRGPWADLGVLLLILGLGTKLGLAPMCSWLPDAYDEAPPAVVALLSAVQFNVALAMLIRIVQIFGRAAPDLIEGELIAMGLMSMAASTWWLITTRNIKRLLAYASINHAGVIAIALAIGRSASYGLLLYALSNAFIKAILFLTAGRLQAYYRTKDTRLITGLIDDRPYSGVFLMCGTFALLGFPPFGSFAGELLILSALLGAGRTLVFCAFGALMTATFVATGRTIFPMIWGTPRVTREWPRHHPWSAWIKALQLIVLVLLGTYVPSTVESTIHAIASSLEPR